MYRCLEDFYRGKRVFVTGHTGFKGTWLCNILVQMGADVTGYALKPPTEPSVYEISETDKKIKSVIGDIRDTESLKKAFNEAEPDIVIHMAAQPIVREGYKNPAETYEINVMGTVNILECVRENMDKVRSVINVTTDKVYENVESNRGYREDDRLNGYDPYSNSKSCSELVTDSYRKSYFTSADDIIVPVSTCRAGNVIGGGDFAKDRIIPDCVRAAMEKRDIELRNPGAVRPFQHVLEPLFMYLYIGKRQWEDKTLAGCYNIGPDDKNCITTGELAKKFAKIWGEGLTVVSKDSNGPHEAGLLKLDCSRAKETFGFKPLWDINEALEMTVEWTKRWINGENVEVTMNKQIKEYINSDFS